MMLGDLGADVVKVERRGAGDETRRWGPPFDASGESAYYLSVNRNKLGVVADFGDPADREFVLQLLAEADVVVDNFLPGALARMGIDPDALCRDRPDLIWCTITGFGPDSLRPGYDFVAQAESGWMAITGDADGDPMKVGVALADVITGKDAAICILAALVRRGRTGQGGRVFVSLADSARAALGNVAQNVLVSGRDARRWGNGHPNLVPYQLFRAADGYLVIAVGSDAQWRACVRALDLPELADDAALATNAGRVAERERVVAALAARLSARPAAEWHERLMGAGVPSGLVRSVLEALRDSGASAVTGVPSPVGGAVRFPPPRLGEHDLLVRSRAWAAFG